MEHLLAFLNSLEEADSDHAVAQLAPAEEATADELCGVC